MFWHVLFFFKQKTAYEVRISDWSSDVCSSDLGPLKGIQFGPGGQPLPFNYGTLVSASNMVGGDGASGADELMLSVPLKRYSTYGRLSYDLTDTITAYVEASWAKTSTDNPGLTRTDTAIRIRRDKDRKSTRLNSSH